MTTLHCIPPRGSLSAGEACPLLRLIRSRFTASPAVVSTIGATALTLGAVELAVSALRLTVGAVALAIRGRGPPAPDFVKGGGRSRSPLSWIPKYLESTDASTINSTRTVDESMRGARSPGRRQDPSRGCASISPRRYRVVHCRTTVARPSPPPPNPRRHLLRLQHQPPELNYHDVSLGIRQSEHPLHRTNV